MEKIIVLSDRFNFSILPRSTAGRQVRQASSRRELCNAIVHEEGISAAVVDIEKISEDSKEFIVSLHSHFPLLKIGIISPVRISGENIEWLEEDEDPEKIPASFYRFIEGEFPQNRRSHHRFDWILHGYLDGEHKEEDKYRVRSLSAGGAFLESSTRFHEPGTLTTIRITFRNFQMFAECTILEGRAPSDSLPSGFGVRFVNLQERSRDTINRMINDAVFQILIEPEIAPPVPSLYEEDLTADFVAL
ncbi:MAG: PilZ domain-containing protein [Spirochaetia bacterium]